MTYTHAQLAQAIIDLQKFVNIAEPVERALRNAANFAQWEKDSTEAAHRVVCDGKFGTEVADVAAAEEAAKAAATKEEVKEA